MSWDIYVVSFSRSYASPDDVPDDEEPGPIGSRCNVHRAVLAEFPGVNWTDSAFGDWKGDSDSIEFNLGDKDPVDSMMLHVRASARVIPGILKLCLDNHWQAIDCTTGEFLEPARHPAEGLNVWTAYRDQMINEKK